MTFPVSVRVNTNANFPSRVKGFGFITVSKNQGIWTISPDYRPLAPLPGSVTAINTIVGVQDNTTGALYSTTLAAILAGVIGPTGPYGTIPQTAIAGATHNYTAPDSGALLLRSNAGAAMLDTLPTGVPANVIVIIRNDDAAALLALSAVACKLDGVTGGRTYLGPTQTIWMRSDGVDWKTIRGPDRCKLQAPVTLYCSQATGSDTTKTGLTAADPFKTGGHWFDVLRDQFDLNQQLTIIQLADGTYDDGMNLKGRIPGCVTGFTISGLPYLPAGVTVSTCNLWIQGNLAVPGNVTMRKLSGTSVSVQGGAAVHLRGMQIRSLTTGHGIQVFDPHSHCYVDDTMDYSLVVQAHLYVSGGGQAHILGGTDVAASTRGHLMSSNAGESHMEIVLPGSTIDGELALLYRLTGAPTFTSFADARYGAMLDYKNATYNGAAGGGVKYNLGSRGIIHTQGTVAWPTGLGAPTSDGTGFFD